MVGGVVREQREPRPQVRDHPRGAGVARGGGRAGQRAVPYHDVADQGVVGEAELDHVDSVLPIAGGRHEPAVEEVALGDAEQRERLLLPAAVVGAGDLVREHQAKSAAVEVHRGGEPPVIADPVRAVRPLGEVVADRDPVVGVVGHGTVGAARQREPGVRAHVVLVLDGGHRGEAVAAEPAACGLDGPRGGEAGLAHLAGVDVAAPVAVEVEAARVRVGGAVDAQRAVGVAAQSRIGPGHQRDLRRRTLVVVREVEGEGAGGLPVGGEGPVAEILVARHPRTGAVQAVGEDPWVVDAEAAGRDARRAVRGAHGRVVVRAGEEGAAGIEDLPVVLDVDGAAVLARRRDLAAGDAEGQHCGGG